jgi:hypothetical protein
MKKLWNSALGRGLLIGGILSACINGPIIAVEWYIVSPWGTGAASILTLLLFSTTAPSLAILLISLIGLIFKRFRRLSAIVCFACLSYFVVGVVSLRIAGSVRMAAFEDVAERGKPLIAAISSFEADRGRPPADLSELVPDFLDAIPPTGIRAYPAYTYVLPDTAGFFCGEPWPEENPWILVVHAGVIGGWDMFVYFPQGNYPEVAYSSVLEEVGDWGYYHE